ncbi:MAG: hypothetical protein OEZ04_13235 [Nitrospinota bacterium]|nr:hypothetical protein [Nitrospinota bacterium]
MKSIKWSSVYMAVGLFAILISYSNMAVAQDEAPTVGQLFIKAFDENKQEEMEELVKARAGEVPGEVKDIVQFAVSDQCPPNAREYLFNIAGLMAKIYGEQTGDQRLLDAVKLNYTKMMKGKALDDAAVESIKKEIAALGGGQWRVNIVELNDDGSLNIEIDVNEASGGSELTPKIDFKKGQAARDLVKSKLPDIKKGKISWSSMGIGLKTVFIE